MTPAVPGAVADPEPIVATVVYALSVAVTAWPVSMSAPYEAGLACGCTRTTVLLRLTVLPVSVVLPQLAGTHTPSVCA